MSLGVDPELLTADALARAAVILAVGILLLVSSLTTIIILCSNSNLHDVIGCYLVSASLQMWAGCKSTKAQ